MIRRWKVDSWTHCSGDTASTLPDPESVVARVRQDGGGVVLMHDRDRRDRTRTEFVLNTTRSLIQLAKSEGWTFVHDPEELSRVA